MSSLAVRTYIKTFLATEFPSEKVIDLSAEYEDIRKLLSHSSITVEDNWLGIQFIGDDEEPVSLSVSNTEGRFREYGAVYFHVVGPAAIGMATALVTRADAIRKKLRSRRFGTMLIERVTPPNTEAGAALQFDFGCMCASFIASYYMDVSP